MTKKLKWLGIIALSWSSILLYGQKDTLDTSTNTLLWKVSGKELKKPSYIFGTIHIINKEDFFFPKLYRKKFDSCKKLVLEIDMKNQLMMALQLLKSAKMVNDTTLHDLYTDEEYNAVKNYFDENLSKIAPEFEKIGFQFFDSWKPMLLSSMMYDLNSEATTSYEMELMEWAKDEKMKTDGLETVKFQASIFDSIPYQLQANLLLESIQEDEIEDTGEMMNALYIAYKSQNINKMYEMTSSEFGELQKYAHIMLDDRNMRWIPIMEKMMMKEANFFAVGAGHLAGRKGVLQLLHEQGYTIEPIIDTKEE